MNINKQNFISKWSNWWITRPTQKEMDDAFERELNTLIEQEVASFISSKQDVIKSVCECSPKNNSWRMDNGVRMCMRCNKPDEQTVL
jgi:hypothetical protein